MESLRGKNAPMTYDNAAFIVLQAKVEHSRHVDEHIYTCILLSVAFTRVTSSH